MKWSDYPIGTKAYSTTGGFWTKTERGWKWCTGSTFPTPGGDAFRIELPSNDNENRNSEVKEINNGN